MSRRLPSPAEMGISGWLFFGTVTSGLCAYSFQVLTARVLGAERYASMSALWTLAFLVGPACFSPVEQETSRRVSSLLVRGCGIRQVVVRNAQVGLVGGLTVLVVIGLSARVLLSRAFDGQWLLLVGLIMAVVGYYLMHLVWGVLAGAGHLRGYGIVTAVEGAIRLMIALVIAGAGISRAGPFGLAIGIAPFAAAYIGWRSQPVTVSDGAQEPLGPALRAVSALFLGSGFGLILLSIAPLAVQLLARGSEQATSGSLQAGFALTRAPLFLFNALIVVLVPSLSVAVTRADWVEFRRRVALVSIATGGIMTVVTAAAATIGPSLMRAVFGSAFSLGSGTLALLGASCTCFMVNSVYAVGLIALQRHELRAVSAGVGCVVSIVVVAFGSRLGLLGRVTWGFSAGTIAMLLVTLGCYFVVQRKCERSKVPAAWPAREEAPAKAQVAQERDDRKLGDPLNRGNPKG